MNNFWIKVIAAVDMVVDHIGAAFFPDIYLMRFIGRLSFPLYAWLLGQGEHHTRDIRRYLVRLLMVGAISQWPFALLFETRQLNILFTLALGLLTQRAGKRFPEYRYLMWGLGIFIGEIMAMDFGGYGVAIILLMANFRPTLAWWSIWLTAHGLYYWMFNYSGMFQLFALPAPLLVYLANQQPGPRARWFYAFYPGHLMILLIIKWVVQRSPLNAL